MAQAGGNRRSARRDYRLGAVLAVSLGVAVLGVLVQGLPGRGLNARQPPESADRLKAGFSSLELNRPLAPAIDYESTSPVEEVASADAGGPEGPARHALDEARELLKGKRYDQAIQRLTQDRERLLGVAEAFLVLGHALEGKRDYDTARDFYVAAVDRDPTLAQAYWGVATTSEALGDLHSALGGMRNFLHTVPDPDPGRLQVSQARSAIWEWEARLGRGPWGPTQGVLWGVNPEQMKKMPGKGAAIMMPLAETIQADGSMKFELKHQEKIEMFRK